MHDKICKRCGNEIVHKKLNAKYCKSCAQFKIDSIYLVQRLRRKRDTLKLRVRKVLGSLDTQCTFNVNLELINLLIDEEFNNKITKIIKERNKIWQEAKV